jgi:membrane protease YdiL (CAAX protease family)
LEGTARPEPRKPDFKRAAKLGLLLASLQIGLEYGVPLLCALLGHPLPSARGIVQGAAGALPAGVYLAYFLKGAFVAPVIEEILFRAVLMEGLIKGFERIGMRKASPWLAGLLSSGAFAAMHTNVADPVWMALYLCGALLYAYAYHHEGLASSASMHWLHNLFYQSQVLANNLYGPAAAMAAAAVLGLAYAAASLPAFKSLRRQWGKPVGDRSIRLPVFLPGSE